MNRFTVLIADDRAIFREGLRTLLAQADDIQVVGEAADGLHAINIAERLQPDILLLDIRMSGLGGIVAIPQIHKKSPRIRVVIFTGHPDNEFMVQTLQPGAKGCLEKTLGHEDAVRAIRAMYNGEI